MNLNARTRKDVGFSDLRKDLFATTSHFEIEVS